MQNHSAGDIAALGYSLPLSPTSWDLGPHQNLFGDNSALNRLNQRFSFGTQIEEV